MSSHLHLAPVLPTGAVGQSGQKGRAPTQGKAVVFPWQGVPLAGMSPWQECHPGRNVLSMLLFPLGSPGPRALPVPPCSCRRCLPRLPAPRPMVWEAKGLSLQAPAEALQPPLPGWREGQPMEPAGSHLSGVPAAVTPAPLARPRRGPEAPRRCQGAGGGKGNCRCGEFVEKISLRVAAILQPLMDLFRRSTAAGGNYSLGGRQSLNSFQ